MLLVHFHLISTNQTSYESARPMKCNYFDKIPNSAKKFDEGFIENWKQTYRLSKQHSQKAGMNAFEDWKISADDGKDSNCMKQYLWCCVYQDGGCCCDTCC